MSKYPCRLQKDNMRRVNAEPHLLSVVPSGRPCLLIMCKLAGVHVTVLYDQRPAHFPGAASTFRQASLRVRACFAARSTTATDVW
jgi:hypothetical protein